MPCAYLCLQQFMTTINQGQQKIDNWGGGGLADIHIFMCFSSRKSFFLVLGYYIHFAEDPPSSKHTSLIIVVETCSNPTV